MSNEYCIVLLKELSRFLLNNNILKSFKYFQRVGPECYIIGGYYDNNTIKVYQVWKDKIKKWDCSEITGKFKIQWLEHQ